MTRGGNAITAVQSSLPPGSEAVLALLTQLGDIWFLVGLLSLVYWFRARDRGAVAIIAFLGAVGLVVGLKATFALPRPPVPLRSITADGYGFPSGHAVAATVGWGVLVTAIDGTWRRLAIAGAATIVIVVAFTRVALGVHYAVDVVAGVGIGLGYLLLLVTVAGRAPVRAGVIAAIAALAGVVLSGGTSDAVLLLGGVIGGLLTWRLIPVPRQPWGTPGVLPATIGGGAVAATLLIGYRGSISGPSAFVLGLTAVAIVFGLPAAVDRLSLAS